MGATKRRGWKIAEVERLVGLSLRDIQRACYQGRGGMGVLKPSDGSWGRRTYDERDLAVLFLLAQKRREGLTLSQAAEQLRDDTAGHTLSQLLDVEAERLSEQLEVIEDRLVRAEALAAAIGAEPTRTQQLSLIHDHAQELGRASLGPGHASPSEDDAPGEELLQELMGAPSDIHVDNNEGGTDEEAGKTHQGNPA